MTPRTAGCQLLLVPSLLLLIIQVFGATAVDPDLRPIYDFPAGLYWPLVFVAMGLSLTAPVMSLTALVYAIGGQSSRSKWILVATCVLFLGSSFMGCVLTWDGHPTWLAGYAGHRPH